MSYVATLHFVQNQNYVHNHYSPYAYCSLDKGVAYLQSGGKSSNTSPPTDVCPHQVSRGTAAAQMAILSNSAPSGANTSCSQVQQGAVRRRQGPSLYKGGGGYVTRVHWFLMLPE